MPKCRVSDMAGLFLASAVNACFNGEYDYSTMCTRKRLLDATVTLPATSDGAPDWAEELGYAWHKAIVGVNTDFRIDCMSFSDACNAMLRLEPNQILCLGRNLGGLRSALLNAIERKNPEKFNKKTVWSATTEHGQQVTSPDESCAIFTTFDGCKGMERDVCFVCDWTTSYLQTRLEKPNARRDILLNIFLVAASRGKRRIIFVQDDDLDVDTEDNEMLTPERLSSVTASRYVDSSLK